MNDSLVVALRRAARDSRGENKGRYRAKEDVELHTRHLLYFLYIVPTQLNLSL
ncbi:MAG: hypothetical protein ABIJ12_10805 [bacterium]